MYKDYSFYGVLSNMKDKRLGCLQLLFVVFTLIFSMSNVFSYDYFTEGESLFRQNKPSEAIPLLYQASIIQGTDPKVFTYLGLCYQQTGKYADAISTFMKGTSLPGTDKKVLFFNAGNCYFLQEQFSEAETMYTKATEIDSAWAPSYLNRGNSRVKQGKLFLAVEDYRLYLVLDPATWQRDSLKQLISLLTVDIEASESAQIRAEAQRLSAEAEQAAAAERYQRIMDEVSASLQSVDAASTRAAGSEHILDYNEEGQLE